MTIEKAIELLGSDEMNGYGQLPLPCPLDDEVKHFLDAAFVLEPPAQATIGAQMTERHGFVFLGFAERMAAMSLRTGDEDVIQVALKATSLAYELLYSKEVIPILSLIFHSARRIGLDKSRVLANAEACDSQFIEALEWFLNMDEQSQSIQAMGYVESQDKDGFRFRRTW